MSMSAGSSSGGSGGGGGGSGPCGACKFLRRKCAPGCIFAPYFDQEHGAAQFAMIHKVFGASNATKMLQNVPVHKRGEAVITICYEAEARKHDPVYGCISTIYSLQQQVASLQAELSYLHAHLASRGLPTPRAAPPLQAPPAPPQLPMPVGFEPATAAVDPLMQPPLTLPPIQLDPTDLQQYMDSRSQPNNPIGGIDALHAFTTELLERQGATEAAAPRPHPAATLARQPQLFSDVTELEKLQ